MEIFDIEFKGRRRTPYRNPQHVPVHPNDYVIVEVERGEHIGRVSRVFETETEDPEMLSILRTGTDTERERMVKNHLHEQEAFKLCKEKIFERKLEMKLVDVEYQLDGNKISFYFTADERIDFRELVRALAAVYRTRIDMRQIGARDETKRACSIGSCGRTLCCGTFLDNFKTVTTDVVSHQYLSRTPSKLLGSCGRLKCCLLYEEGYYEEAGKRFPKLGARIETETGPCHVIKIDVLGNAIAVRYDSGAVERISSSRLGRGYCDVQNCSGSASEPDVNGEFDIITDESYEFYADPSSE